MTPEEIHVIAKAAAKETISEWLLMLGINASTPEAIIKLQHNFATLASIDESIQVVKRKGLAAAVTVLTTSLLGALWFALSRHH